MIIKRKLYSSSGSDNKERFSGIKKGKELDM